MNRPIRSRLFSLVLVAATFATHGSIVAAVAHAGELQGAVMNVAAVWQTSWGSESCQLTLLQDGAGVTGAYVTTGAPPGRVAGQMVGNVLTGQWTDAAGGVGGMRLVFAQDGRSFTGTWGSGGSIDNGGGWQGRR